MNILIPHSWLLEHLDTKATPTQIQKELSLSGPSVERIEEREGESVYDVEITTNRVDCMSIRGIAREAAVILTQAGIPSKLKKHTLPLKNLINAHEGKNLLPIPKITNNETMCKRILACVLTNVSNAPSPEWMQKRLRQIDVQSHGLIVDVTNYITHEFGHPCHAFDYDKIMKLGGEIHVRKAQAGKHFTTLDGIEYTTVGGEVVFENAEGTIIDLPAIKGTHNTAIDDSTSNVLFWIESIVPKFVRFASMTHAIRTTAAQLNEKGVSPLVADDVFSLGLKLYASLGNAAIASQVIDIFPSLTPAPTVRIPISKIDSYLGLALPKKEIIAILKNLGLSVKSQGKMLTVAGPYWRSDIEIPEDIIEEVARIYGYHRIPSILMTGEIPTKRPDHTDFDVEHETKIFLSTLGGYEVYTYSFISEALKNIEGGTHHVALKNPLTDDMAYMRTTLWASHIGVITNYPDYKEITVFELANIYKHINSDAALPQEELHLTLTSTSNERKLKGILEALCSHFYLPKLSYKHIEMGAEIMAGEKTIGTFHIYPLSAQKNLAIIDIAWKDFLENVRQYPMYEPISKFSPIYEDLTLTIPSTLDISNAVHTLYASSPLIKNVSVNEQFKSNVSFTIQYQPIEPMSPEDMTRVRKTVIAALEKLGASLIGSVK